jgi:signal transduction histidine kinase/DNA-binding response OmpR family regulator/ligand-binding sensor domain-containing protein
MSKRFSTCSCMKATLILTVFCSALILSATATMAVAEVAKVSTKSITRDTPLKFEFALDLGGNPGVPIIQDRDGFLWFTSMFNGLVRFDGTHKFFLGEGENGISNDFASQVYQDSQGIIWIGTNDGLNRYDKTTNTITRYYRDQDDIDRSIAASTFNLSASTIIEDRSGKLWFGTQAGLSRFDRATGTFTNFRNDPNDASTLSDNDIYSLYEDREGLIWVGTKSKGVNRLDPATGIVKRFIGDMGFEGIWPTGTVRSIVEDRAGNLWFATREGGLIRREPGSHKQTIYENDPDDPSTLPQIDIWNIVPLRNGEMALTDPMTAVGLLLFDPSTGTYRQHKTTAGEPGSLSTNTIFNVLEDRSGTLWVVHNNGKVDKMDPNAPRLTLYRHNPLDDRSPASNAIIPIYEDRYGQVWMGHFGAGLDLYHRDTDDFMHFEPDATNPKALPYGYPAGFLETYDDKFIVSMFGGMVYFDPQNHEVTGTIAEHTSLYTMVEDHDDPDIIWAVGWEESLNRIDRKTLERKVFLHDPKDPHSFSAVTSVRLIRDRKNPEVLWIATWGGGLEAFNTRTQTFTHHRHSPDDPTSISSDTVYDVLEDSRGQLWVSTDKGLNKFDRNTGTFKRFNKKSGFVPKLVHNILEDRSEQLWMGTNVGLVAFDLESEKIVKIYTTDDGVHSYDFFPTARGQSRDGQLWFGGFKGVNRLNPESLQGNPRTPQIYLTQIKKDGQLIKPTAAFEHLRELGLDWRSNSFEFEYVALNYTVASKNRYQFKLEGHDRKWYDSGHQTRGRYTNLPGGSYTLRVRGTNNDGLWSTPEQELRVAVHVSAPPWKTWWANAGYALLAITTIVVFLNLRLRAATKHKEHLQKLVDERTAELTTANIKQNDLNDTLEQVNEELSQARIHADDANQAKSAFLANMSHELRTPMNAVLGYSEMLIEEAEDIGQDDFIPDLKKINQAGNHLLSLINDVLDLSKIESGKMEAFAEVFDVGGVIDQVAGTAQPLMNKNDNKFKIERGEQLGHARQDITKLRQSLLNLLSNAAKFTHEGTITLQVERERTDGVEWLTFAVNDTGIGIAADKLDHVFEEFSQADSSTTRDYGGTGLGLAISRRFCQMLGGDLTVASQPGAGSTFSIRLPAELPGAEASQKESPQPIANVVQESDDVHREKHGSTVLVIDDDTEACEIVRRFLEKDGFNVVTAASGEQGLRLAHEIQPVAITLDVMMPEMDGWSVLRALKADPVLHIIPVIMLTMIDDRTRGYSLGVVDYLTKPVDRGLLHKTLSRYYSADCVSSVLLVENDIESREMMARTLEKAGWEVSEAGNGQEALDIMSDLQPRLILLDLMMPVMDGFGFLAGLRERPEWQQIPVIVITAKDLTGDDRDRLAGRVEEVLEKNAYTREQLLQRVSEAVTACNISQAVANDTGKDDE